MSRASCLTIPLLAASLVVLLTFAANCPAADAKKPNVIVFLSDDVGYGEYGFQGNKQIPTPNIDSIAKGGVRFTQGYVSGPYCSPTRAGLMTGRYQTRFGHEFNEGGAAGTSNGFGLPLTETTIADRMNDLGYATCAVGKWHLGGSPEYLPMKRGFDEFFGTVANTPFFNPPNFVDSRKSNEVHAVMDDKFYYDRRLRRAGRRLDRAAQGQAVLPVLAVQRPARAARRRPKNTSSGSRTSRTKSGARSPP